MQIDSDMINEFRIEEFKALRAELLYQIQSIDSIKFWVTVLLGAYYSFLFTKFLRKGQARISLTGPILIWLAPVLAPIWGIIRLHVHTMQLTIFSNYIKTIEDVYPGNTGWEHFYTTQQDYVWVLDYTYFALLIAFSSYIFFVRLTSNQQPDAERPVALSSLPSVAPDTKNAPIVDG